MKLCRREFLGSGAGAAALALGLNAWAPAIVRRKLIAAPPELGRKKLVYIFLRGGMDAVNAVVPRGDPNYSLKSRPTLFLEPGETIHLDGSDKRCSLDKSLHSFVELHPSFEPVLEVYQAGNLAVLHRIGYKDHNQSHFESQQFLENGTTDQPKLEEGMLYRQALEALDLLHNHFAGFGLSERQIVALKGRYAVPNAGDIRQLRLGGAGDRMRKLLGCAPGQGRAGSGLLGVYGASPDSASKPYRSELHQIGATMAEAMQTLSGIDPDAYKPANGAVYPEGGFGSKARQAAHLLKETPVELVGMNLDGFDTHGGQGKLEGAYPGLLRQIAAAYQALYRDLRDQWKDVVVVALSEFGRTSEENGSKGTDHGNAMVMFVAGGAVKGGVYNAPSPEAWCKDGGVFSSKSGRYLTHWTDYRAVFAEVFAKHFGDDPATVSKVIPKLDALAAERPKELARLGFLA
ncbi:MAG: DUF1501 domain-containing protein [Planctomycetes bacterium]|nr:DUF1501 domain-containing protein [Planctomycetota bacterium]